MVPEWLSVLCAALMYGMGFLTCGAIIGNTPFWDGVRQGFRLVLFIRDSDDRRRKD